MENTEKLEQAKSAILSAIIETCKADLGSNAEAFARGFGALVSAETQAKMTEFSIRPCDCDGCRKERNDDFDEVIGEDA